MEETEHFNNNNNNNNNNNKKNTNKTRSFRTMNDPQNYQYHHQLLQQYSNRNTYGFGFISQINQYHQSFYPALLPLPTSTPLHPYLPFPKYQKPILQRVPWELNNPPLATSSEAQLQDIKGRKVVQKQSGLVSGGIDGRRIKRIEHQPLVPARRPDSGGVEGHAIALLANHFSVKFDESQKIFHYDVEITPRPSKDIARIIKRKLVKEHSVYFCNAHPVFDGGKTLYSPVQFQHDKLELFISLPFHSQQNKQNKKFKLFRVKIRLVSKLDGKELSSFLKKQGDEYRPLPQEYLHALDVVLRESSTEKCISSGRSFYSSSMGDAKGIGNGAVALKGFFQSLRPTQQGLALNVNFSVTAFHESTGVINYLQKRIDSLHDLFQRKVKCFINEERKEVEKAMKNIRVFVCHRENAQRYRVLCLTEDVTEDLWFHDRDGSNLRLVTYFKDQYDYDIQFRNLPCLQVSRSKPCYLPIELCVVCEGQKFLGKLNDEQTSRILEMSCQRPKERKATINQVMAGPFGPTSGDQGNEFKLEVSREMTKLKGRILQPPKLKFGDGGQTTNLIPSRRDRQWNLLGGHVYEGTRIERWALISFGGSDDQRSNVPKFINQLSQRCEHLGIFLNKSTTVSPQFEPIQVLNSTILLESKLKKIHRASLNNLQLLICLMERKHKGYADLKRISETNIGVISQCCLYQNITKPSSQFLANLSLKINAKIGGCTVALFNSFPSQLPRILKPDEPVIFMGADVTHPHPLDDFSPSVAAVVGSVNWPAANKYVSRMRSQTHRQEIIQDLTEMVAEILEDFCQELLKLPKRIIFFRDGVSETQFQKVLQEELEAIRAACLKFPSYNPPITFAVVQKRHHTRLFPDENEHPSSIRSHFSDENIPPGTVVDSVITHPREFDFYLCSHWGVKGTSRPIHYHILWDENQFTSDELQKLVYNLCYTFVRCTKPISLVPPAYYAHLAAYRGRLYLERSDCSSVSNKGGGTISRTEPPKAIPLPKLTENLKNLMFYC